MMSQWNNEFQITSVFLWKYIFISNEVTFVSSTTLKTLLTLKVPSKIAADDTFIIFTSLFQKKIRLDVS